MFWQLINSFFLRLSYSLLFLKLVSSKEFIFVLQRDEPEDWTSSLWTNTLELHQQDFRATNVIDWEECFANKTVETYIFLSLMSYSLNIYLNYINKTINDKDPPWMSGWNRNCVIKWKKQCLNMLGQENFYLTHPPT